MILEKLFISSQYSNHGDMMDKTVLTVGLVIFLLACAGVAFAASENKGGAMNWKIIGPRDWQEHGVRAGFVRGDSDSQFNSTEMQQFMQAIKAGDYATAKSLHDQFGVGGKRFDLMNETSFAALSEKLNAMKQGNHTDLKPMPNGFRLTSRPMKCGFRNSAHEMGRDCQQAIN
ncbi:MAG: hypothetical protein ABII22_01925, partial [Candidatus Micrarchaeota archaeon]